VDLARKAENEGRLSEAIKYYNQILDLSPGDIRADKNLSRTAETVELARMISLGAEQFYNNQFPQAKKSFENVLRIDPENGLALEYIERIDELTRKPGTLEDIREDEETWNIYLNAMQLYQEGKYSQAIELWQKVLDKYPGNDETLENIRQANLRLRAD
jgi:tetratricopeptide (TPR) repeat protein